MVSKAQKVKHTRKTGAGRPKKPCTILSKEKGRFLLSLLKISTLYHKQQPPDGDLPEKVLQFKPRNEGIISDKRLSSDNYDKLTKAEKNLLSGPRGVAFEAGWIFPADFTYFKPGYMRTSVDKYLEFFNKMGLLENSFFVGKDKKKRVNRGKKIIRIKTDKNGLLLTYAFCYDTVIDVPAGEVQYTPEFEEFKKLLIDKFGLKQEIEDQEWRTNKLRADLAFNQQYLINAWQRSSIGGEGKRLPGWLRYWGRR